MSLLKIGSNLSDSQVQFFGCDC